MNKQNIITIMLALIAVAGISNAFDFSIDDEDVTIAVNKDVAGYDIPNKKTAVGIATDRIHAVEANGGHVGVNHNKGVTCAWPVPDCASYSWQSRRSSSAIASIRLFSASCAPSLPCETDLRMS